MMKTIRVKLKQHTPLLHFQSTQDGATLRASEVKPRLDAFLHEQGIPVPRYKMRIVSEGNRDIQPTAVSREGGRTRNIAPMFFGVGKDMVQSPIVCMCLTVFEGTLSDKQLISFFAENNFGTRQTKGYGSFTVSSIDGNPVPDHSPKQYVSYFEMNADQGLIVLKRIELLAKTLRGGINGRRMEGRPAPLYFKSLMFSYAKEWNCHWDKRNIKECFLNRNDIERQNQAHGYKEPLNYFPSEDSGSPYHPGELFDFRDCLGFSTHEDWLSYRLTVNKVFNEGGFSRYKSPIVFKPMRLGSNSWRIYVIAEEFPEKALDKTVRINNRLVLHLFPDFSVFDYLKFAFCEANIASHFDNVRGNEAMMHQIKSMYSQLRSNYRA